MLTPLSYNWASGRLKNTVAGFARIQFDLNSGESSYESWMFSLSPLALRLRITAVFDAKVAMAFDTLDRHVDVAKCSPI